MAKRIKDDSPLLNEIPDEAIVTVFAVQVQQYLEYLTTVDLPTALWWFIENTNEDAPYRSELFFYLRQRVRMGL